MTDNINPKHYRGMSNGAEVIDIAENVTYNAGNAIKYLARACRIDGDIKSNPAEDLLKARWYINREIERMNSIA